MDPKAKETQRLLTDQLQAMQPKLLRFAFRFMGNKVEAEDVVQETFIRIWKNRKKIDKIENLESWCMTITRNIALDELKKRKRHRTIELDHVSGAHSKTPDIHRQLHLKDAVEKLKAALEKLPTYQKMAIHLRDIEGYSYKEIEKITGMSLQQVKVNIHRGRQKLRLELKANFQNVV